MDTCLWRGCQGSPRRALSKRSPRIWRVSFRASSSHLISSRATSLAPEIYTGEGAGGKFVFQQGPVFGNLILADEINRAPAKAQAALLEAMEERQVTVGGTTHKLPDLFLVLATQNPIEQEGTYPLPEAQMDRFLLHVFVGYSNDDDERKILRLVRGEDAGTGPKSDGQIPAQVVLDAQRSARRPSLRDG
jgi:MoxR-like ATPase